MVETFMILRKTKISWGTGQSRKIADWTSFKMKNFHFSFFKEL